MKEICKQEGFASARGQVNVEMAYTNGDGKRGKTKNGQGERCT